MKGISRAKTKASRYVGVTIDKRSNKKWCAKIKFNKKFIFISYFKDEKEAARTYNKKAVELSRKIHKT
jgi:hypothetical protein